MSLILHIETSTDVCSACLASDGEIIASRETGTERSHAGILTVFIEELLGEAGGRIEDLCAVAVSKGPGSYTGLRIGVSAAKGICYAVGIPLIAIPTLKAMCFGAIQGHGMIDLNDFLIPMIDARRMEVYLAVYNKQLIEIQSTSAQIIDQNTFQDLLREQKVYLFGTGAAKLKNVITHKNVRFFDNFSVSSEFMVSMALQRYRDKIFEDVAYFEPYYLKDFIATTPRKNQLLAPYRGDMGRL